MYPAYKRTYVDGRIAIVRTKALIQRRKDFQID